MGSVDVFGGHGRLWRSRWAAIGAAVAVTLGGGGLFAVQAATSAPSSVVTIDPVRILDTRDPVNIGLPGPFVSAVSQKLQVTGAAVPAGATGVLLNVTVVTPTANGFLSVRPGDAAGAPSTSSLNFNAGDLIPNSVQVGLPTAGANAGKIDITYDAYGATGPTTDVLIDVVGYTLPGARGPSSAYYVFNNDTGVNAKTVSLVLPPGRYTVTGSMYAFNRSTTDRVDAGCNLSSPADGAHYGAAALSLGSGFTPGTLQAQTVLDLPSGGTVNLVCQRSSVTGNTDLYQARILATQVDTLN